MLIRSKQNDPSSKATDKKLMALLNKQNFQLKQASKAIESAIRYKFSDRTHVYKALAHRSLLTQLKKIKNAPVKVDLNQEYFKLQWTNERLEFLGDAVLDLVISNYIFSSFPNLSEGDLSKMRSSLVNETALAEIAIALNIGDHILMGRHEAKMKNRNKASVLADTVEAIFGAVYLDGGYRKVQKVILTIFKPLIDNQQAAVSLSSFDPKTQLQELTQKHFKEIPEYILAEETGKDHKKLFKIIVKVCGVDIAAGVGSSKKKASQDAAAYSFEIISQLVRLGLSPDYWSQKIPQIAGEEN